MAAVTSESLLKKIAGAFAPVRGVKAIVLGGSRGRGVHQDSSDYDIALYYENDLDIAALDSIAVVMNQGDRNYTGTSAAPLMTKRGGWGAWVDGGGWLTIDGEAVDILYRDCARVERVIADCHVGTFECAYHYGHPHAFVSTMYAGEIATCRALHDPSGFVSAAKPKLNPYPEVLRSALITRFLDEARFFLTIATKAADSGDIAYVAGCAFRAEACLMQVLFALNRQWLLNEKGALALSATFPIAPTNLKPHVERAFMMTTEPASLRGALEGLLALAQEIASLS